MTGIRLSGLKSLSLYSLIAALLLLPALFLTSCSDSEKRLPSGSSMSRVILNLGASAKPDDGRMAAAAPSDLTSISVTVTGPGMEPISSTFTAATDVIELSVPSGPSRLFVVVANSASAVYSGTAVASLPAGATVSVPIIMAYGGLFGFQNEGSIENPVVITPSTDMSSPHVGQVGPGGVSYYSFSTDISYMYMAIYVMEMTDDVDLFYYASNPLFNEVLSPNFGQNFCGRKKSEVKYGYGNGQTHYFTVDGTHAKSGAAYAVFCVQTNDMLDINGHYIETLHKPSSVNDQFNYFPSGLLFNFTNQVGNTMFFMIPVTSGKEYWINANGLALSFSTLTLFNGVFSNPYPAGTTTFTPTGSFAYFTITSIVEPDDFSIEVTADEGTQENPIELYQDESEMDSKSRANFCMVGGSGSSYYRFPVTYPKPAYINNYAVTVQNDNGAGDIDLYVFSDPEFSTDLGFSATVGPYESVVTNNGIALETGYLYVRVDNMLDTGETFILDVIFNPM